MQSGRGRSSWAPWINTPVGKGTSRLARPRSPHSEAWEPAGYVPAAIGVDIRTSAYVGRCPTSACAHRGRERTHVTRALVCLISGSGTGGHEIVTREELVDERLPRPSVLRRTALERRARQLSVGSHLVLFPVVSNRALGGVLVYRVAVVRLERVVRTGRAHLRRVRRVRRETLPG